MIGATKLLVKSLLAVSGQKRWFPIYHEKKLAGELLLEC
jgi:hypothetical protein